MTNSSCPKFFFKLPQSVNGTNGYLTDMFTTDSTSLSFKSQSNVTQPFRNPRVHDSFQLRYLLQISTADRYLVQRWWSVLHWQTRLNLGSSVCFSNWEMLLHWTRPWCSLVTGSRSVIKSNNPRIQKAHRNFWNPLALQNWKEEHLKSQPWVFVVTRWRGGGW